MATALEFRQALMDRPHSVPIRPAQRHGSIFIELIRTSGIEGPLTTDAYLAVLAIEHGCEMISADNDFARFPGLRWKHPLAAS